MSLEPISLLLLHQQGPASPAERTRQCSQTMAHWTRAGSEGDQLWCSASVRTAVLFCVATAFFVAWSLASQVATASGEGSPAPLGSSMFAVPQYSHSPGHEIESSFCNTKRMCKLCSGLQAPLGSPATPRGVAPRGRAPLESRRSGAPAIQKDGQGLYLSAVRTDSYQQ